MCSSTLGEGLPKKEIAIFGPAVSQFIGVVGIEWLHLGGSLPLNLLWDRVSSLLQMR